MKIFGIEITGFAQRELTKRGARTLSVSFILLAISIVSYVLWDNSRPYVDKEHHNIFSKDSCSQFILCMVNDFETKNWTYKHEKLVNGMDSLEYDEYMRDTTNMFKYLFITNSYSEKNARYYTNGVIKFGNFQNEYRSEYYSNNETQFKVIINSCQTVNLNEHELYYVTKAYNKKYDKYKAELDKFVESEANRALKVKDSLHVVQMKNLHDKYFPNCK